MTKVQKPVSLFLVFALVFMFMACPLLQPKADAIAPVIAWVASDAVFYIVTFALGLVGVHFASKSDMAQAVNQFLNDNPTIKTYLSAVTDTSIVLAGDGSHKLHLTAELYSWIATTLVPAVSNYFSRDKETVAVSDYSTQFVDGVPVTVGAASMTAADLFSASSYSSSASTTLVLNNVSYVYSVLQSSYYYDFLLNGSNCRESTSSSNYGIQINMSESYTALSEVVVRYGFYLVTSGGVEYLNPYIVGRGINSSGNVVYKSSVKQVIPYGAFPLGESSLSYGERALEYLRDMGYSLTELISTLKSLADAMTGALDIPIDDPVEDVVEGKEEAEEGTVSIPLTIWTNIWALLGLKELMKSLTFTDDPTNSDNKYKPSITEIPGIAGTWGYVTSFLGSALIWMQLWFDGFTALPAPLKSTLWAVLVITIFTGLLGVFLR